MLIHGRLLLTANNLMLDEVRSLLQKSLRRKDTSYITKSAKELLCYGKDQLPWKSITTFLFEDHCLSHASVLEELFMCYNTKNKKHAVEVLSHSYTCRIAACLPVVALDDEYSPVFLSAGSNITANESEQRLVASQCGQLDFDVILQHLKKAWLEKDQIKLISCLKLVSMMFDIEKVHLTQKGVQTLISNVKSTPNIGHLVMSLLYKATTDAYFKRLLRACFNLLSTPDICVRLVLFIPAVQMMFKDNIKEIGDIPKLDWKAEGMLDTIPHWAVDKHTFRGKFGKEVSHLISRKKIKTGYENTPAFEEFYGVRPKSDIGTFFNDGCVCNKQSVDVNPYWERTIEIYFEQAKSKQKTVRMTKDYYATLKKTQRHIFKRKNKDASKKDAAKKGEREATENSDSESDDEPEKTPTMQRAAAKKATEQLKRGVSAESGIKEPKTKRQKVSKTDSATRETDGATEGRNEKAMKSDEEHHEESKAAASNTASFKNIGLRGPLLQLPTGSAKVYTCIDLQEETVWKGPYRESRLNLAVFLHKSMDVLGDKHTSPLQNKKPYLVFPLLKGDGATLNVSHRGFYDAISKQSYPDGQFIEREALGIVQLHRLTATQIHKLPITIWAHFAYRFALNIGDSGIYNALTDRIFSFVYGIDMEENRMSVKGNGFLDLIFTKQPNKKLCVEIKAIIKQSKSDLDGILSKGIDLVAINDLARHFDVEFDEQQFRNRMRQLRSALERL